MPATTTPQVRGEAVVIAPLLASVSSASPSPRRPRCHPADPRAPLVPRAPHEPRADSDDESAYAARPRRARGSEDDDLFVLGGASDSIKKSSKGQDMDHTDSAVAAARASRDVSPYVLHANTPFRGVWDMAQIIILVYVALAVPYRMGFDADAYGGWYVLEFLVDLYFWVDLVFGFFTAYWEHREDDDEVVYVVDLVKIREHYLRTWFTGFLSLHPRGVHQPRPERSRRVLVGRH